MRSNSMQNCHSGGILKRVLMPLLCVIPLSISNSLPASAFCGGNDLHKDLKKDLKKIFGGMASWYGGQFHGRKTASGSKYDMNKLTCAHKTLPFGTKLLVFNPQNGRQVEVVVTDRGPYVGQRVIDLSKAAADKLCISGIGNVVCYAGKKVLGEIAETMHIKVKASPVVALKAEKGLANATRKLEEPLTERPLATDSLNIAMIESAYEIHGQITEPDDELAINPGQQIFPKMLTAPDAFAFNQEAERLSQSYDGPGTFN